MAYPYSDQFTQDDAAMRAEIDRINRERAQMEQARLSDLMPSGAVPVVTDGVGGGYVGTASVPQVNPVQFAQVAAGRADVPQFQTYGKYANPREMEIANPAMAQPMGGSPRDELINRQLRDLMYSQDVQTGDPYKRAAALMQGQQLIEGEQKRRQGLADEDMKRQKAQFDLLKSQRELTGKAESTYDKELAKRLAEADAAKLMAKTPGTPEYERIQKEARATQAGAAREQSAIEKADVMIGKAEKALGKLGFFTTGLPGQILSNIGGTEARDLAKTVDTIKANIGFAELQKMRQESPTGGALGQVAVKELDFLQSAIENLDTAQSQEQLAENLKGVITHYNNFKKIKASAPQGADGGSTATPTSVTLPNGRTLRFPSGAAAEAFKREAGIQ